jgi:16S rRNA processing protein RimM
LSASNPKSNYELVPIGKVGRPHGLRGAFFVSDRDDLVPRGYGEVYIGVSAQVARLAKILSTSMQGHRPVLLVSLASDRSQAEALTHQTVFVPSSKLRKVAADAGGMLWWDLEGATVVDSDGKTLGIVRQVYNTGASDVIEITTTSDHGKSQTLDLPLIDDYVDLKQKLEPRPNTLIQLKVPGSFFEDLWHEHA